MKPTIQDITNKAEKLYEVRDIISELEEESKKMIQKYKDQRDVLQTELIADMNDVGLASIKVKSGESYIKSIKKGIAVSNEALAFKWALQNKAVKPDLIVAAQIIKEMKSPPAGFKVVETEFISVRKGKK